MTVLAPARFKVSTVLTGPLEPTDDQSPRYRIRDLAGSMIERVRKMAPDRLDGPRETRFVSASLQELDLRGRPTCEEVAQCVKALGGRSCGPLMGPAIWLMPLGSPTGRLVMDSIADEYGDPSRFQILEYGGVRELLAPSVKRGPKHWDPGTPVIFRTD